MDRIIKVLAKVVNTDLIYDWDWFQIKFTCLILKLLILIYLTYFRNLNITSLFLTNILSDTYLDLDCRSITIRPGTTHTPTSITWTSLNEIGRNVIFARYSQTPFNHFLLSMICKYWIKIKIIATQVKNLGSESNSLGTFCDKSDILI